MNTVDGLLGSFKSDDTDPAGYALALFLHENGFTHPLARNGRGWSPICYAALAGDPLVLAALIQRGADVNDCIGQQDPVLQFVKGTTVLDICACLLHNSAVRLLLDSGANVRKKDMLRATAAHWACVGNNVEGGPRCVWTCLYLHFPLDPPCLSTQFWK